jgi:hypothetical protein
MPARLLILLVAASAAALSGCGSALPCDGVEAGGMCWVARDGVTVTAARAQRVYDIAKRYWGGTTDPEGWTVEIGIEPVVHVDRDSTGVAVSHVVDGSAFDGWFCPRHRRLIVRPYLAGADCFEASAIFHELGHYWGARDGEDARLYGEWALMREAMNGAGGDGCPAP